LNLSPNGKYIKIKMLNEIMSLYKKDELMWVACKDLKILEVVRDVKI